MNVVNFEATSGIGTSIQGDPSNRQWLVEGVFPRARSALVIAAGGIGKSYLLLQLARDVAAMDGCIAAAQNRFGGALASAGTAVYLTAEDDALEVHSRLHALGEIPDRLYAVPLINAGGVRNLFARHPRDGGPSTTTAWLSLTEQLHALDRLCLVVLDPLQGFCALDLNSPANAQFVCAQLAALAASTGAAVIVSQSIAHGDATWPESERGDLGGALADGMRAVHALWPRSDDNAPQSCTRRNASPLSDRVICGGVIKANGRANGNVTTFVRDHRGVLVDCTTAAPKPL